LTEDNHSFHPVLSPDGMKIAYLHIKAETCEGCLLPAEYEIYVMHADGTSAHLVAGEAWARTEMRWSPDGKTLAYSGVPSATESSLYLVGPDNTDSPRLVRRISGSAFEWSPDGKRIAHGCPASDKESRVRIRLCLSETSAGGHSKVMPEGALPSTFSWSPDGSRVAFVVAYKKSSALFVAGTDGSPPKSLTELNSVSIAPQWSSDGKRIVFADADHGKGAVYVVNADGGARQRLTDPQLRASNPMWSPDEKQIAFTGVVHESMQIYLVNADRSKLRAVMQDEKMGCNHIAWSGDSKLLLLRCGHPQLSPPIGAEGSSENLYVVAVNDAASRPRQLTKDGISDISFAPVKPGPYKGRE
jgi:Tol biopolymer transport system component